MATCGGARKFLGLRDSQSGAVTFIQRFGDALNCNVHFHLLAIDGVYTRSENRNPEFHELPAPEDDEIVEFTTIVATRIEALLERRGIGSGSEDEDALSRDDPGMAALYASSIRGRIAVGSNVGYRVARLRDQIDGDSLDVLQSPCCATVNGFSVHANVSIPAHDRMRLEDLQPDYNPVGADRMALNDDHACGASVVWRKRSGAAELR